MASISVRTWGSIFEKTVETKASETNWPVYDKYRLFGSEGSRCIHARETGADFPNKVNRYIDPLVPEYADLFLKFARWFDEWKMEKAKDEFVKGIPVLDTNHNAQAALAWAHEYGVLGLGQNPYESFGVSRPISNSAEIAAERLGMPNLGPPDERRAYRKGLMGGKHETVEGFVHEACEANIVLKLYEAATAPSVDASYLARFMPKTSDYDWQPTKNKALAMSAHEMYSGNEYDARFWALSVVEDAVTSKVENDVYPILLGKPGSYEPGWGFKSLLGAMWFQMRNFMLGGEKCLHCGRVLPKTRSNRIYCDEVCGGRYRAARAHERKKRRQQEAREKTRRRLRKRDTN